MFDEYARMRAVIGAALAVMIAACTRPNPQDCADGLCTDPAYPFCDIDGALEGEIKTCIAVTCTPGEFRACRDGVAITCNNVGNDYDLVACPLGCDATNGCRACAGADDCANPSPVCDSVTNACRACKVDDECESTVCENGSCMNEANILYVKPNGSDTSDCTRMDACSLLRAATLARGAAIQPTIRLLPAVYATALDFDGPTTLPLRFVGTGATIAAQIAIRAQNGAQLDIRGVAASGTQVTVQCTSAAGRSAITLRDTVVTPGEGGASLVSVERCDLRMFGGELDIGASTGSTVFLQSDATFIADRLHIHGTSPAQVGTALSTRIQVFITNSLLENVSFQWATSDTSSPGSSISMGFNTMVLKSNLLNCRPNSGSAFRTARYQNNIVVSSNPTSAVDGTDCMLSNNVLFPFSGTAGTNIVADPLFENSASRDYRLQGASPAVDAAMPTALLPATVDYAGTMRPQGAAPDIGAFELAP